jgi:hypothetical protein
MFYDRFAAPLVLQADQLNGLNQLEYVVKKPDFYPLVPLPGALGPHAESVVYQVDPNLRAPYVMQLAASVERQVSRNFTASLTYFHSRGVHQLLTDNINAPLPGTYDPSNPASGVRPFANLGNVYQYESVGIFNQNQLITNFTIRGTKRVSLMGFYSLNYANSDTGGPSSFPSLPYDIAADYGRAAFDIRHRALVSGSISLPYDIRLSPLGSIRNTF